MLLQQQNIPEVVDNYFHYQYLTAANLRSMRPEEMAESIHEELGGSKASTTSQSSAASKSSLKVPDHNGNATPGSAQGAQGGGASPLGAHHLGAAYPFQSLMGALTNLPPAVANAAAVAALNLSSQMSGNSSSGSSGHSPGADRLLQSPASTATSTVSAPPRPGEDEEGGPDTPPNSISGKDTPRPQHKGPVAQQGPG